MLDLSLFYFRLVFIVREENNQQYRVGVVWTSLRHGNVISMFHQQGDQVLKEDLMVKRATGRGRIKTYGYKQRVFVLRYNTLSYYEGTLEVSIS